MVVERYEIEMIEIPGLPSGFTEYVVFKVTDPDYGVRDIVARYAFRHQAEEVVSVLNKWKGAEL